MKYLLLFISFSIIFAFDRGNVVSYELLETLSQSEAQIEIDDDLSDLSLTADYNIISS